MRDDEVMFGIQRYLQVVADNSRTATTAVHRPGVWIGQRYLMIGRRFDLYGHVLQEPHLAAQARDLLADLFDPRLWNVAGPTIGTIEGRQVAFDAGLDLLDPLAHLVFCVVPIPVVYRLELAAVDCDGRLSEQTQLAAQHHKLAADRPDRGTIVPSKIGDRLEVRRQSTSQPHQFDIALGFALQAPARLNPVQIAVKVNLEHRRRKICRATGMCRRCPGKANRHQIQLIDEGLDDANRVIFGDIIIERCRQQVILPTVLFFHETAHHQASRHRGKPYHKTAFLHSLGRFLSFGIG